MTVTFETLGNNEFGFEQEEVFFEDTAGISEVLWRAREICDKYNLNFVRFRYKGSLYSFARV